MNNGEYEEVSKNQEGFSILKWKKVAAVGIGLLGLCSFGTVTAVAIDIAYQANQLGGNVETIQPLIKIGFLNKSHTWSIGFTSTGICDQTTHIQKSMTTEIVHDGFTDQFYTLIDASAKATCP